MSDNEDMAVCNYCEQAKCVCNPKLRAALNREVDEVIRLENRLAAAMRALGLADQAIRKVGEELYPPTPRKCTPPNLHAGSMLMSCDVCGAAGCDRCCVEDDEHCWHCSTCWAERQVKLEVRRRGQS